MDYINYGFIHCQDESIDWKSYRENGILDYLLQMKRQRMMAYGVRTGWRDLTGSFVPEKFLRSADFAGMGGYIGYFARKSQNNRNIC